MKIENLKQGMLIKNYKELCRILEEQVRSGGRNVKLHMEDLSRYFDCEKQGQKIFIKEVYEVPKEKSLGGNNTPYIKYIENLILDLLAQSIGKGNDEVFLSKNKLLKELKMINDNYAFCKYRILKLSKFMNIDKEIIDEWYLSTDSTLKRNLEKGLDNLRKQALIIWSSEMTVCEILPSEDCLNINKEIHLDQWDEEVTTYKIHAGFNIVHREATKEEKQKILHTERDIMIELGYENKQDIVRNGVWDMFKDRINDIILKELNISFYYDSYKIIFNPDHISQQYEKILEKAWLEQNDRETNQKELNNGIVGRLKINSQKRQNRALEETENWFGEYPNKKIEKRTQEDYIDSNNKLVDTLIDKNSKSIKTKVKKVNIKDN